MRDSGDMNEYNSKQSLGETNIVLNKSDAESKSLLAGNILRDLSKEYGRFKGYNSGYSNEIGINTQLAGGMSMLMLLNMIEDKSFKKDEYEKICLEILDYSVNYIDKLGFTFSPFVPDGVIDDYFKKDSKHVYQFYSIECLTWMLSFLVQIRAAARKGIINLPEDKQNRVMFWIKKSLELIRESCLTEDKDVEGNDKQKPIGWGSLNRSNKVSLYFTAMVVESLSEFDDNVIVRDIALMESSETDIDLIKYLGSEVIEVTTPEGKKEKYVKGGILEEIYGYEKAYDGAPDGLLQRTSKWIWNTYSKQISKGEFADIEKRYSNNKAYYLLYIMEIMILSYTEYFISREELTDAVDKGMFFANSHIAKLKKSSSYLRSKTYKIEMDDLDMSDADNGRVARILEKYVLYGAPLIPIQMKLSSSYAFYFTRFPDKSMSKSLKELLDDSMYDKKNSNAIDSKWLWDSTEYTIIATEKAVEALVDFFSYFEEYEEKFVTSFLENEEHDKTVKEGHEKIVVKRLNEEFKIEKAKAVEEAKKEVLSESLIESAINKTIEKQINKALPTILQGLIQECIDYNHGITSERGKEYTELFGNMIFSYLNGTIMEIAEVEEDKSEIKELIMADVNIFIKKWMRYLYDNGQSTGIDNVPGLKHLFKIENNKIFNS